MCAAPKGNQFYKMAVENLGRPPKYETFEDLHSKIVAYFESQSELKRPHYTLTGLAAFLGFSSRRNLFEQGERGEDFYHLIQNAINLVASCYENNLYSAAPAGAIFALKNIKPDEFKDKTEVDQKVLTVNWHEEKTYEAKPQTDHND